MRHCFWKQVYSLLEGFLGCDLEKQVQELLVIILHPARLEVISTLWLLEVKNLQFSGSEIYVALQMQPKL